MIKIIKIFELTCWQIEINVGVNALESGVVPKNRTILIGFTHLNQSVKHSEALFASRDVLPQPPSPNKTNGFSESLCM